MKGYCKICGKVVDEVVFTQFGCCEKCYEDTKEAEVSKEEVIALIEKYYTPNLIKRVAKVSCFLFGIFILIMVIWGGWNL